MMTSKNSQADGVRKLERPNPRSSARWLRALRMVAVAGAWFVLALLIVWAAAAIFIDFRISSLRIPLTLIYALVIIAILYKFRGSGRAAILCFVCFLCVLAWWFTLKPTNDANWEADHERLGWAEVNGDRVTIHNLRNCTYRTETDYSNCWTDRTVALSQLRAVDLFLTNWGLSFASHPILSFQFGENDHVAFSVEARYRAGQKYSTVLGFFRQFGLMIVAADERDVIRLRTNYRKDEEVYLYRVHVQPEVARAMFLTYIAYLNQLKDRPEWYNELTRNCTTALRKPLAAAADNPQPWNYQFLLNGTLDALMYDRGRLVTGGLSFPELKQREHINAAAHAAGDSENFSALIRAGRVGY